MNIRVATLIALIIGLFLMGCSTQPKVRNTTGQSTLEADSAYPMEGVSGENVNGYPAPDSSPVAGAGSPPTSPLEAVEPETGRASVSGVIYSYTTKINLGDTQFYLTPAKGENQDQVPPLLIGPEIENGDIALSTNRDGSFSFNNIPPGSYFLAVWAPYTWVVVQKSEGDASPLLLNLEADQKYSLGVLYLAWP